MTAVPYTAADVRRVRDLAELGMMEAKAAFELVNDPVKGPAFNGDVLHAACAIYASHLAINVRGDRDAWNFRHGRGRAERLREMFPQIAEAFPAPPAEAPKP